MISYQLIDHLDQPVIACIHSPKIKDYITEEWRWPPAAIIAVPLGPSKLETIIADYNKQAAEEAKVLADRKKAIQEMADDMIRRLEQVSYQRQVDMLAKMKKMTQKINEDLQATLE